MRIYVVVAMFDADGDGAEMVDCSAFDNPKKAKKHAKRFCERYTQEYLGEDDEIVEEKSDDEDIIWEAADEDFNFWITVRKVKIK